MKSKRVYIATPYSQPDQVINVQKAISVAECVLDETDWLPFVPHLFHLWHLVSPHPYGFWMTMDRDWMETCHAVLAPYDMSEGVKQDLNAGTDMGLPIFLSLTEFVAWTREQT